MQQELAQITSVGLYEPLPRFLRVQLAAHALTAGIKPGQFLLANVETDYADRVTPDGFTIEPFGLMDNCMVEGPVHETDAVVIRHAAPAAEIYTCLDGFTECVRQAVRLMSTRGR